MKNAIVIGATLSILMIALVQPVEAEHESGGDSTRLSLDLQVGSDTFRLDGRLVGPEISSDAWLAGQVRPDGFRVDGRLRDNNTSRAFGFSLSAELLDALGGAARGWVASP